MNFLPSPLHPAAVHFPIVLILLGAMLSVVAAFWRKDYVPGFAAALLALAALGAWTAIETGESDGGLVEQATAPAKTLLDAHEDWAKRTLTAAAIAAVIAVAAAALFHLGIRLRLVMALANRMQQTRLTIRCQRFFRVRLQLPAGGSAKLHSD